MKQLLVLLYIGLCVGCASTKTIQSNYLNGVWIPIKQEMGGNELPSIAFPVLEPELFGHKYSVNLNRTDLEYLKLQTAQMPAYLNIITIPDDATEMTANIKAPIVINVDLRIARQCVLQDNHLAIKEKIFTKLQSRVVQNPQTPIKSQGRQFDMTVKVSDTSKPVIDQEL